MDLSVRIPTSHGDFVMKNPIMPAAAAFGNIIEYEDVFDLSVLGALMPNSLSLTTGNPNRIRKFHSGDTTFMSAFGPNNISAETFVNTILPELPHETTPIIVNTKAKNMDEMEELAAYLADVKGISGIEINLNCPYFVKDVIPYWKNPETLAELIRRVKAVSKDMFVTAKVPSCDVPLEMLATAIKVGGADAFTCYNGIEGCSVDIYTRKYHCGGVGRATNMGFGLKQYALRCTQRASQATDLPAIGSGGIISAKEVLEHIMVGAYIVQVGSANLMRPDFMPRLLDELVELMEELGINSFDEIRGVASVN